MLHLISFNRPTRMLEACCLAAAFCVSAASVQADIIVDFDAAYLTNNGTNGGPFNAGDTISNSNNRSGIPNGMGSTTSTVSFEDAATGLEFTILTTYTAINADNVNAAGGQLGVGTDSFIDTVEGLDVAITSVTVDSSGYILGSIPGIIEPPSLLSANAVFTDIRLGSYNDNNNTQAIVTANGTPVTITADTDGTAGIVTGDTFNLATIGLTNVSSFELELGPDQPDRFNLVELQYDVSLEFEQPSTSTVPEPSSLALLGLGATGLLVRRRR